MNTEKFKTICKVILLYFTLIVFISFIMGGPSLVEKEKYYGFALWLLVCLCMAFICRICLTYKDVYKYTGMKWCENHFK